MRNRPHLLPALVTAVMLLGAVAPLPYEYYNVLRWVTCVVALHIASVGVYWRDSGTIWAAFVFPCIAILFNPLNPIHLTKEIWIAIDLVCSGFFIYAAISLVKPKDEVYGLTELIGGWIAIAWFTALGAAAVIAIWLGIEALMNWLRSMPPYYLTSIAL